jgi:hypothetical protein
MVRPCVLRRVVLLLAGMLAACASPGAAWRAHERGLPPEAGDPAVLWKSLAADAIVKGDNGDLAGLHARSLDASYHHQPIVYLRVDDGWLVGVDHGEWGGALWWVAAGGAEHRLLATENVRALVATEGEVVAVTGSAHLMLREGGLLHLDSADHWGIVRKTPLPSTPTSVAIAPPLGLVLTFGLAGTWCSYRDGQLSPIARDLAWAMRSEPKR